MTTTNNLRPELNAIRKTGFFVFFLVTSVWSHAVQAVPIKLSDFGSTFEENVLKVARDSTDPSTLGAYRWPFTVTEMSTLTFISDLKNLIVNGKSDNNKDVVITSGCNKREITGATKKCGDIYINISGILLGQNVYMRIVAEKRKGKIVDAYPTSTPAEEVLESDIAALNADRLTKLTYDSSNWNSIRNNLSVVIRNGIEVSICDKSEAWLFDGSNVVIRQLCPDSRYGLLQYDNGQPFLPQSEKYRALINSVSDKPSNQGRLHLLNVESGNCGLLLCPKANNAVLFDCGVVTGKGSDFFKVPEIVSVIPAKGISDGYVVNRAVDILVANNINKMDVVISHADNDHFSLIQRLLQHPSIAMSLSVNNVYLGTSIDQDSLDGRGVEITNLKSYLIDNATGIKYGDPGIDGNGLFQQLPRDSGPVGSTIGQKLSSYILASGGADTSSASDTLNSFCGTSNGVTFLAANEASETERIVSSDKAISGGQIKNAKSIVTKVGKVLLTADARTNALNKVGLSGAMNDVVVLTVPHHGSRGDTHRPAAWMDNLTSVKHLIYQAGSSNNHPERYTWDSTGFNAGVKITANYSNKASGLDSIGPKDEFFANTAIASESGNMKRSQRVDKSVYVSSTAGEIIIDDVFGTPMLNCLGTLGLENPTIIRTVAQAEWDNRDCLPDDYKTYLSGAGSPIPVARP